MYPKIIELGTKIDPKSMKKRACDADTFLERFWMALGCQTSYEKGSPFRAVFGQKSKKTKKKWIRPSGTVPERSRIAKKTIFERLGQRLVFWMVFSLKMAYLWSPFSMKKPSKNPCWFWTRKSHDFWWKINAKTAWVFALFFFLFFWLVFEKCLMQNTVLKPMNCQCV